MNNDDLPVMNDKMELRYLNLSGAQRMFGKDTLEHLPVRVTWYDAATLRKAGVAVNARVCNNVFEATSGHRIGGSLHDGCDAMMPSEAQIASAQAAYRDHCLNFDAEYLRNFAKNALIQ